jgi:hypothetical protein
VLPLPRCCRRCHHIADKLPPLPRCHQAVAAAAVAFIFIVLIVAVIVTVSVAVATTTFS